MGSGYALSDGRRLLASSAAALEILKYLREENVFGALALHAVGGFLGWGRVTQPTWWEARRNCQSFSALLILTTCRRVLPRLREMAAHRLIVRESVVIETGQPGLKFISLHRPSCSATSFSLRCSLRNTFWMFDRV